MCGDVAWISIVYFCEIGLGSSIQASGDADIWFVSVVLSDRISMKLTSGEGLGKHDVYRGREKRYTCNRFSS